jgi:hypothetical protein
VNVINGGNGRDGGVLTFFEPACDVGTFAESLFVDSFTF